MTEGNAIKLFNNASAVAVVIMFLVVILKVSALNDNINTVEERQFRILEDFESIDFECNCPEPEDCSNYLDRNAELLQRAVQAEQDFKGFKLCMINEGSFCQTFIDAKEAWKSGELK